MGMGCARNLGRGDSMVGGPRPKADRRLDPNWVRIANSVAGLDAAPHPSPAPFGCEDPLGGSMDRGHGGTSNDRTKRGGMAGAFLCTGGDDRAINQRLTGGGGAPRPAAKQVVFFWAGVGAVAAHPHCYPGRKPTLP